jgi:hypothetical protein
VSIINLGLGTPAHSRLLRQTIKIELRERFSKLLRSLDGARPISGAPLALGERFWVRELDWEESGKKGAL